MEKLRTRFLALPFLIYLLPMLGNMIVSLSLFVNAVRLARMGASATVVASTLTTWSAPSVSMSTQVCAQAVTLRPTPLLPEQVGTDPELLLEQPAEVKLIRVAGGGRHFMDPA